MLHRRGLGNPFGVPHLRRGLGNPFGVPHLNRRVDGGVVRQGAVSVAADERVLAGAKGLVDAVGEGAELGTVGGTPAGFPNETGGVWGTPTGFPNGTRSDDRVDDVEPGEGSELVDVLVQA